ncbi:MAG: LuxR C-terminal-related transcriptional regulator, partial [Parahaliea sp.]
AVTEQEHGVRSVSACALSALLADALYEMDKIVDARSILAPRIDMLRFSAPEYMYRGVLNYARLLALLDSTQTALGYLQKNEEQLHHRHLIRGMALMKAERVRLLILAEDYRQAESLMPEFDSLRHACNDASPEALEIEVAWQLSRARLSLIKGENDTVYENLDAIDRVANRFNRPRLSIVGDLLRAVVLLQKGEQDEAESALKSALSAGFSRGMRRLFKDEIPVVQHMIQSLDTLANPELESFRNSLFVSEENTHMTANESLPYDYTRISTEHHDNILTRRERDILELLEKSMPNKRIASTLNLSVHTVKWNLKNIFAKLGVTNRYDAITSARKLKVDKATR